ncbi:hypothetical protein [Rahnella sp. PCH160]
MPLETGIKRLDDGSLMVAVRTDLQGCKGRVIASRQFRPAASI